MNRRVLAPAGRRIVKYIVIDIIEKTILLSDSK